MGRAKFVATALVVLFVVSFVETHGENLGLWANNFGLDQQPTASAEPLPAFTLPCGAAGMDAILATIRRLESGGRYDAVNPNAASGASGAYQFVVGTWNGYGGYRRAVDAPPHVQDAKAREHVEQWLRAGGGVEMVPVGWYIGHIPPPGSAEWDTVPAAYAGNVMTPRQYQQKWLGIYRNITGPC